MDHLSFARAPLQNELLNWELGESALRRYGGGQTCCSVTGALYTTSPLAGNTGKPHGR